MACVVCTHDAEPSTGVLELDLESFHLADEDRLAGGIVSGHSAHFHKVADLQSTLHGDRQVRIVNSISTTTADLPGTRPRCDVSD